jgi:DNA-binding response OmpR family regulator
LEEQGYAVDAAFTGRETLDYGGSTDDNLIAPAVLLPELDGRSVCHELRRRGSRIPILMFTARDSIDDRVTGLDSWADDHPIKSFAIKEPLARLRAIPPVPIKKKK